MHISCLVIVDSNQKDVATTKSYLELSDLTVERLVVATSLWEALKVVHREKIDVILVDLDLEDSNSLDTLHALRKATNAVLIVLSRTEDELLGIQAIKAGADDFLVKSRLTSFRLRSSIVYSITRHQIRSTACQMREKIDRLAQLVGA